jgi:hypothetical protein
MAYGLKTFKANGDLAFDSSIFTNYFYYGDSEPQSYNQSGRVSSVQADGPLRIGARYYGWYGLVEIPDKYVDINGVAQVPSLNNTYGSLVSFGTTSNSFLNLILKSKKYASFGSDAGTFPTYGIKAFNEDNISNISLTSKYATILESGSVSVASIIVNDLGSFPNWNDSGDQWFNSAGSLLTFSRALNNQPLIFITNVTGSGSVSLHNWQLNGGGQYTGVYLTSHQTPVTWNTVCSSWTGDTSCTVSYTIVDLDEPPTSPDYGLEIYDSNGTRIWNSDYTPISIEHASNVARPYAIVTANGSFSAPSFWSAPTIGYNQTIEYPVPVGQGILLNSMKSVTGIVVHRYYDPSGTSQYYHAFTPYGEYLTFYESGGTRYARVKADFTHNVTIWGADGMSFQLGYSGHFSPTDVNSNPFPLVIANL